MKCSPAEDDRTGPGANWAGNVTVTAVAAPGQRGTRCAGRPAAAADGQRVHAVGGGHSFTPIAVAPRGGNWICTGWTGIVPRTPGPGWSPCGRAPGCGSSTRRLDRLGLALANLGDIDVQTVAGAMSTGTHGTGARLGGLATQIEALQLVLADGSVVACSARSARTCSRRPGSGWARSASSPR